MIAKLVCVGSAAAVGLCLAAAAAGAEQTPRMQISPQHRAPMQQIRPELRVAYSLSCRVQGTPVEFPDDIVIINNGPGTVPAGTKLHWWMTKPVKQGDYVLGSDLASGKQVFIGNAVPGGLPAGLPCGVKVVK